MKILIYLKGFYGYLSPQDTFPKAKVAAEKALLLDNKIAEVYASLAWISFSYEWEWDTAENEFMRAIQLNPNYAMARNWYTCYLLGMGRSDEAIIEAKKALVLDPVSPQINAMVANALYFLRRYDEALEQIQKTLEIDINCAMTYWYLGFIYLAKELYEESIDAYKKFVTLSGGSPFALGYLGSAYATSGQNNNALQIVEDLNELSKERYVSNYYKALIYLCMNEMDQAFENLDKSCDERESFLSYIKYSPMFDPFHSDPRFKTLLKKIGLPED